MEQSERKNKSVPIFSALMGIAFLLYLVPGESLAGVEQVTGLQAQHQAGQTFLIWKEVAPARFPENVTFEKFKPIRESDEVKQLRYRLYRSKQPITSLKGLNPIAEVQPLSGWNTEFFGVYPPPAAPVLRYVVTEGKEPIAPGMGLYVHNPQEPGEAFYAVTVLVNGKENPSLSGANSLDKPIKEEVGRGEPVLQRTDKPNHFWFVEQPTVHYYTRWESPPNSSVPGRPFDYLVAIPPNVKWPAPIALQLHAWGGYLSDGAYGWWYNGQKGALMVATNQIPYDWWTGYHEFFWTDKPLTNAADWKRGVVRPFTQRRLLSFLEWVGSKWRIDRARTFVAGVSMGGSGSLMLAIRYPQHFAWALSWVGLHIPSESPQFRPSYAAVYGEPEWGVKYEDGTPVWDYYNDVWYLRQHPEAEIGFLTFANGKNDAGITWPQAVKFFRALQETKRPHLFSWGPYGHGQRAVMPGHWMEDLARQGRVNPIDMRVDQSQPAFTNSSFDNNPGNGEQTDGDPEGQANLYLYWETKDVVDEPDRWEMTVGVADLVAADSGTVDITPRRCQRFHPKPGEKFRWTAKASGLLAKGEQRGEAVADKWGLVTIERVVLPKGTTRLTISR